MAQTVGEKWFQVFNYVLLGAIGLMAVLPFINILAQSLSSHNAVMGGLVSLLPVDFTWSAYRLVMGDNTFFHAMWISVQRTVAGALLGVFITALLAYPLSKRYIRGRNTILFFLVFSILFNGGIIPTFFIIRWLHLLDTIWVLILPTTVAVFHVIIMKNFFQAVPFELEESAKIDGCSNLGIFFRIIIPLSMPVIATIILFKAVMHWNSFFDAVLYVSDKSLYPLQVYVRDLISYNQSSMNLELDAERVASESLKAAALFVSMVPILVVYPFMQKYFTKGIMLGSVKG